MQASIPHLIWGVSHNKKSTKSIACVYPHLSGALLHEGKFYWEYNYLCVTSSFAFVARLNQLTKNELQIHISMKNWSELAQVQNSPNNHQSHSRWWVEALGKILKGKKQPCNDQSTTE